jgi:hypothetical protein
MAKINKQEFLLTLSPKYVPHWGKWEAFRELMQNVIDRSNEYDKAEIIFIYNEQKQRITIGNKLSALDKKTLILGETTKADNDAMIGKYGEGYKLALLVFLRLGIRVRIRTSNEVWAPAIKFSEQYNTDLLAITVMETTLTDNLLFELDGITSDDYRIFKSNCLKLNTIESKLTTYVGDVLLDDQFRSKLFVEGLFVCQYPDKEKIRYGYNIKAGYIDLDRDRQKVETFNFTWETSRILHLLDATYANLIYALKKGEYNDVMYFDSHSTNKDNPLFKALCTLHHDDFITEYGRNVIPVKSHEEANFVREKYNGLVPILLTEIKYKYVTSSSAYVASTKAKVPLEDTPFSITKRIIMKFLSGRDNKDARDKLIAELLPLTRAWKLR